MENKPRISDLALRYGLILGFAQIAINLILYIIDKELMVSFWVGLLTLAVSIIIIVMPVRQFKRDNGSILFKEAFLICLITMAGAGLISTVFNYVLYNIIDPDLSTFIKEQTIQKTVSVMEKFGASEEDIAKSIEGMNQQDFSFSAKRLGSQYLWAIVFSSIPALIIAAIMRTKQKPFDDTQA